MLTARRLLFLIGMMVLVMGAYYLRGCVLVDRCLDAGGRWNYEAAECDGARPGG